jgi:hypothetical protein
MRSILNRGLAPALLALAAALPAHAQQNPTCVRLEAQLDAFDRSGSDPARAAQIKRLEDAVGKQQADLEKNLAASKRLNCEGGFFLFSAQSPQCPPISAQIQQQRAAIERGQSEIARLQGANAGPERDSQRRAILVALSQNDCGEKYRAAVAASQPPRSGGLFEALFGPRSVFTPDSASTPGVGDMPMSGNYRTICVRLCDGYYWPISFSATPAKFLDDARACQSSCPATEVALYAHRNPGEDANQAVSTTTQLPYTGLPNAFKYRQAFDNACSCRGTGQTWSQALKQIEDSTVERGDVVVTEERARQLSQPRFDAQGKPIRQEPPPRPARIDPKTGKPVTPAAALATSNTPTEEGTEQPDPNRSVRAVGPTFIPR